MYVYCNFYCKETWFGPPPFSGAGNATVGIPFQTMLMRHLLLLIDYGWMAYVPIYNEVVNHEFGYCVEL